jgi:hypothetical protein
MNVPRDLRKRMLEAVEGVPAIDVHERLVPESQRIGARHDFISWFLAYAGDQASGLGLEPHELDVLADVQADPEKRWSLMASCWPCVRTTIAGRMALRVAWELFGIEDVNEQTWKELSARLWKTSERGFYREVLCRRANVPLTLVDGAVDAETRPFCAPVGNYDGRLSVRSRPAIEAWMQQLGVPGPCTSLEQLVGLVAAAVQGDVERGCAAFKLESFPDLALGWPAPPSAQEVTWSFGRAIGQEDEQGAPLEPALHSYLGHRFLDLVARTGRPVLACVAERSAEPAWRPGLEAQAPRQAYGSISTSQLGYLAHQHPQTRFMAIYAGDQGWAGSWTPEALLMLARSRPNVALALGEIWGVSPRWARRTLLAWIQGVPLHRLFALGGGTTMVEAACVQALFVREQVAAVLAEMVADGDLDEGDAYRALQCLLFENARDYLGLQGADAH